MIDGTTITNAAANHHQLMIPNKINSVILGEYEGQAEIVYYPTYKYLCWQPHPEWEDSYESSNHVKLFKQYIDNIL